MKKEEFLRFAGEIYDTYECKQEKSFLNKLFQYEFSYDDEARTCTVTCPVSDFIYNSAGIVHGGVLTHLADTSMGHLNYYFKHAPYVSLELKTSFYEAVKSGVLTATARYVREGYKVCFIESEITNEQGQLICKTSGTFYRYEKSK